MGEEVLRALELASHVISLVGVVVVVTGFLATAAQYPGLFRRLGPEQAFNTAKIRLGNALLLGLEILVVADVIETITVKPTLGSLVFLAGLVVVRTIVSWTLTLEVEGKWPWQPETEA